jgi:hypothetical protein
LRDILTGLAALLVLALFGALIAPRFMDWDSRRAEIAAHISAALGMPVRIDGPVSVTLLPTPALKLGMVQIGAEQSGNGVMRATIGRIKAEAAISALFKGELRLTSLRIDGADVTATSPSISSATAPTTPLAQSRLVPVTALDRLAEIGIGKLTVASSRLRLVRGDGLGETLLRDVEGAAEAGTLLGPWRGNMSFRAGDEQLTLRFSTVRPEGTSMRLRTVLESDSRSLRAEYDGRVDLANGVPVFDGAVTASGHMAVPLRNGPSHTLWRMQGKLKGERGGAAVDDLQVSVGAPEKQVTFTGAADVELGARFKVRATLSTKQVDLDRAVTPDNQPPASPQVTLGRLQSNAQSSALPLDVDLDISAGKMMLGGDVINGPRAVLDWREGVLVLRSAEAEMPGRTTFSFAAADKGATEGQLVFSSRAPQRLAQWFTGFTGPVQASSALEISGGAVLTGPRIVMRAATLKLDTASLTGSVDFDASNAVPRLTAVLKGEGLDLANLPQPQASGSLVETDLTLDLAKVRYHGKGAGSVRARLWRKADALIIEALDIRDLLGANLSLKGSVSSVKRDLTGRLEGTQLDAMVSLLTRLVPHPMMASVGEKLKAQAPVALDIVSGAEGTTGDENFALRGKLGGLEIDATLRLDRAGALHGRDGLAIALTAPTPEPIARLIGLEAISIAGSGAETGKGPARVVLSASNFTGGKDGPFQFLADLAGTRITAGGFWNGADWTARGSFALETRDLAPLAQSLLITVPAVPPGFALSAKAELDVRNLRITLANLDANASGQRATGELAFNLREFGRVSGQIRTGQVDATTIAPLIFGVGTEPVAAPGWSTQPFGPVAAITLPGDLYIEADAAHMGEGFTITRPRFVLRFETGLVYLEHARGEWQGGMVEARATLRRADKQVAISGDVTLTSADASKVFAEPNVGGRLSADVELSGSGPSAAALMASLAGTGTVTGHDVVVPRIRPGLLQGLLNEARRDGADITGTALARRAEQTLGGGLALASEAVPLSIAAGTLRLGPMAVPSGEEHIDAGLSIDIPRRALTGQATFTARQNPAGWTGPPPRLGILLRREGDSWRHVFDTAALSNGLMAVAVEREQERVNLLEQDQRERSRFNRQLRAGEQQREPTLAPLAAPRN